MHPHRKKQISNGQMNRTILLIVKRKSNKKEDNGGHIEETVKVDGVDTKIDGNTS